MVTITYVASLSQSSYKRSQLFFRSFFSAVFTLTFSSPSRHFFIFSNIQFLSLQKYFSTFTSTNLVHLMDFDRAYRLSSYSLLSFHRTLHFSDFFLKNLFSIIPPKTEKTKKLIKIPIVLQLGITYNLSSSPHVTLHHFAEGFSAIFS